MKPREQRPAGSLRWLLVVLVIVLLLPATLLGTGLLLNRHPKSMGDGGEAFRVLKGETVSSIAERLRAGGFIRSSVLMRVLSRATGTEGIYKAGYYKIPFGATTVEVHNLLIVGNQDQVKVTIPEGWTIKKIARQLESLRVTTTQDFLDATKSTRLLSQYAIPSDTLEGYLFPDTYFFPTGFTGDAVVDTMVQNFFKNLDRIVTDRDSMAPEYIHRSVTMASIIEREYRIAVEAPVIASVFYNRLKWNIGLESCATLEYIITEIQEKPHPKYITLEDKRIESAYNTYMWAGLPPGPISNPGVVALDAAFYPAETEYYYFVLKDGQAGEHHFSKDLEEHNQAKIHYLKKVGSGL